MTTRRLSPKRYRELREITEAFLKAAFGDGDPVPQSMTEQLGKLQ